MELFSSNATLEGTALSSTLTTSGVDLGATATGGGSRFGFDFDGLADTLDLGLFNVGDTFTVDYLISVTASGPGRETGVTASIGDPFDLSGNPGISLDVLPPPTPVPTPGTLLLVVLGLALLGWRHRSEGPAPAMA